MEGLQNTKIKVLEPLTPEQSVELFFSKNSQNMQRLDELTYFSDKLQDLNEATIEAALEDKLDQKYMNLKPCSKKHSHTRACTISYLSKHPIFDLYLAGHPLLIHLVSNSMRSLNFQSVTELFRSLLDAVVENSTSAKNDDDSFLLTIIDWLLSKLQYIDPKILDLLAVLSTVAMIPESHKFNIDSDFDKLASELLLDNLEPRKTLKLLMQSGFVGGGEIRGDAQYLVNPFIG